MHDAFCVVAPEETRLKTRWRNIAAAKWISGPLHYCNEAAVGYCRHSTDSLTLSVAFGYTVSLNFTEFVA